MVVESQGCTAVGKAAVRQANATTQTTSRPTSVISTRGHATSSAQCQEQTALHWNAIERMMCIFLGLALLLQG